MARILILGGTRFIGPQVVAALVHAGHAVTLFHRGKTEADLPRGVREIFGDRLHLSEFADEWKQIAPEIVVDMIPLTEREARIVLNTFKGMARRVVVISSADVYRAYGRFHGTEPGISDPIPLAEDAPLREKLYPYRGETPRSENDPHKFLDDYDKILVERTLMSYPGLSATVLRLPMVYGPGDYQHRLFEYVKRMEDRRRVILLDEGTAQWRTTRGYVENVAAAIALAAIDDRASNRIYNVCEMQDFSAADWVREIAKVTGWNGKIVVAPKNLLPAHRLAESNTEHHLVMDSARIRKELGYMEPLALEQALERTIDWERSHPPEYLDPNRFDYAAEDAALEQIERAPDRVREIA